MQFFFSILLFGYKSRVGSDLKSSCSVSKKTARIYQESVYNEYVTCDERAWISRRNEFKGNLRNHLRIQINILKIGNDKKIGKSNILKANY